LQKGKTCKKKEKIQLLKSELKRLAKVQRERKQNDRFNESSFDKIVTNKYIEVFEVHPNTHGHAGYAIYRSTPKNNLYRELKGQWSLQKKTIPDFIVFGKEVRCYSENYLTALHILYNELRNKNPHVKERRPYVTIIEEICERIEMLEGDAREENCA
jgi:hypothetical protein